MKEISKSVVLLSPEARIFRFRTADVLQVRIFDVSSLDDSWSDSLTSRAIHAVHIVNKYEYAERTNDDLSK